ncbi:MAG: chain-length determining protein [Calditerrivibrio nitroreducens]|uniref:Chain-length determining protein n=1 Tax=Calditerrivibrio nitroreducens TaxID=477976 RepID=A0A2J6WM69_9BACT|nr:MAG: chain-length determining protein [Calditerrivibrio nitroreducens]
MEMDKKEQSVAVQYVQYVPNQPYQEDEIDLKDLIKTIMKRKYFIITFTMIITLLAAIYAFLKTPIYEINSNLKVGYIINSNSIEPKTMIEYIKGNFDNSKNENKKFPQVDADIIKQTNDLINIKIRAFSNNEALAYLDKILDYIHKEEDKKISFYKENIKSQIKLLEIQITEIEQQINALENQLKTTKNPLLFQILLSHTKDYQIKILENKLKITDLNFQLSPLRITKTDTIGKVLTYKNPKKPNKILIITVAFVTGIFLSIFIIFFIDFAKNFKEE